MAQENKPTAGEKRIKFFSVGGTIDKVYFDQKSEYQVGEPKIGEILAEANVTVPFESESVLRKDSLDMNDEDRGIVCERIRKDPARFIVVTHGTDTMIETAKRLEEITGKVIVLTGSMAPASFKSTDADFNIGCAVSAVQSLSEGVYIVMNGRIFTPRAVWKNVPMNRFEPIEK